MTPPLSKTGKVIAVHPEDSSVDVLLSDGIMARRVPVLQSAMGTTHGLHHAPAPSFDAKELGRKTYKGQGEAKHAPSNSAKVGRDQYVVLGQLEGIGSGAAGLFVQGYLPSQVSEMQFSGEDPEGQSKPNTDFSDLLVFRHPSDVQVTIEQSGKLSIQHPSGTRITIGPDTEPVNLQGRDLNQLYKLRENLRNWANFTVEAFGPVEESETESELKASVGGTSEGVAALYAQHTVRLVNEHGCEIVLLEDGSIEITASGEIRLSGSTIKLN